MRRNPESINRSARIATAIRAEMRKRGITSDAELRRLVEKHRGAPVSANEGSASVWMSRRMTGGIDLVKPVRVVYGPTRDLEDIAAVLGVPVSRFLRVANNTNSKSK
jgi:hypothetical protein